MQRTATIHGTKVSFYLKRKDAAQTSLFALFFHEGKKTKIYTSVSIDPKQWDSKEQKAKTRNHPNGPLINDEIGRIADTLTRFYAECRASGYVPSEADLRACIVPVQADDKTLSFWQAWEQYFEKKAKTVVMRKKLTTIRNRVRAFEAKHPEGAKTLHLDRITANTLEDFATFLTESENLQLGTVKGYVRFLKTFLHWCVSREITENTRWKGFTIAAPPDTLKVALSKTELDAIRNTPLPHDYLRNCRDLFLIGCLTGLRFSDYTRIQPQHVKNGMLTIRQQKTDDFVEIPLTQEAQTLIQSLINGQTRVITNQRMNEYLKELMRLCGIDEPFEVSEFRGKLKVTKTVPKWQLIGTHTARRTLATNLLLAGIPAQVVMQYTGHKDYKSFAAYVNIPKQSQHDTVRQAIALMA